MIVVNHLTLLTIAFFSLMAIVASLLFRSAAVPLYAKTIVPLLMVLCTWAIFLAVPNILGYPMETAYADLPIQVEIIAFVPHDAEKTVDLWLQEGNQSPRAYSTALTDDLKKALRQAQGEQAQGRRAELVKGGKKKRPGGVIDIDAGKAPYELDPDAFSLPAKGDGQ